MQVLKVTEQANYHMEERKYRTEMWCVSYAFNAKVDEQLPQSKNYGMYKKIVSRSHDELFLICFIDKPMRILVI